MPSPFLCAAALAGALLPCFAAANPLSFDAALQLAVERSEATRAARAGALSATQTSFAAGQLPDPTLRIGVDNLPATGPDRLHIARDSMTMKRIGISQEWLSTDKRAARQAAADAAVDKEMVQTQVTMAEARLQTGLVYVDAFYAGEALKLATLATQNAAEAAQASRARLTSATGSSQEVLALAGVQAGAEDDAAELQQQLDAALIALQRWIGVIPGLRSDELLPPTPLATPSEAVYVTGSPSVATSLRDRDIAQQLATVTAANRHPNWTWELAYGQRSGYSDMVSVGVSIPLPVAPGRRQDRDTAAKLALVDKAEADLAEASRAATAQYRALRSDAQRLQQRIDRHRSSVIALAAQRTATTTAAYGSNQGSLIAVFDARQAAVEAQRKLLTLQRELARTQVQLALRPLNAEGAR